MIWLCGENDEKRAIREDKEAIKSAHSFTQKNESLKL